MLFYFTYLEVFFLKYTEQQIVYFLHFQIFANRLKEKNYQSNYTQFIHSLRIQQELIESQGTVLFYPLNKKKVITLQFCKSSLFSQFLGLSVLRGVLKLGQNHFCPSIHSYGFSDKCSRQNFTFLEEQLQCCQLQCSKIQWEIDQKISVFEICHCSTDVSVCTCMCACVTISAADSSKCIQN